MPSDELLLPATIARELEIEGAFDREPTCEAASVGTYADSRRKYVHCGVAGDHFAVASQPMAAAKFCFGAYETCPLWQRDRTGRNDELRAKLERRAVDRATSRQVEVGMRVDDRTDG